MLFEKAIISDIIGIIMSNLDAQQNSLGFIRDVAAYFMDFLETDFHKRRLPKRSIKTRNNDNLLVGFNLQKYPTFRRMISDAIKDDFRESKTISIGKGVYKTNLPKNLISLIKLQVEKIPASQVNDTISAIAAEIENVAVLFAEEHDLAVAKSYEIAEAKIKENLVSPFVSQIEKSLKNQELGTDEDIYLIEEELSSILLRQVESKIAECLNLLMSKSKVSVGKELKSILALSVVKNATLEFFENLQVADIYNELFELERNKGILDKQELYLYFGDISYSEVKYPLFYLPFSLSRREEIFDLNFDSQVYVNKKALEYIVQEYNVKKDKRGTLGSIAERIIYLGNQNVSISAELQKIVTEISSFFELDKTVGVSDAEIMQAKSQLVRLSNAEYISLFDKSDEALVNDYEDILRQLDSGDSSLAGMFTVLVDDFINKNPTPFNPEVEDEWDALPTPDRLVPVSPIPLNSEQLQILLALNKEQCKYVVVQGPPGTGKSHTITAIIFNAILKNQSVLVLSDKKEALDVVEEKITSTMDKVRFDKNFQNPILRLGDIGGTYGSILAKSSVDNINTHYRATKKNFDEVEQNIEKLKNSIREDLEAEIVAYGDINIEEIHELCDLEPGIKEYSNQFNFDEILICEDAAEELDLLRSASSSIKNSLESPQLESVLDALGIDIKKDPDLSSIREALLKLEKINEAAMVMHNEAPDTAAALAKFEALSISDIEKLDNYIDRYKKLNNWLFGYAFSKKQLDTLNGKFASDFPGSSIGLPHKSIEGLVSAKNALLKIRLSLESFGKDFQGLDRVFNKILTNSTFQLNVQAVLLLNARLDVIVEMLEGMPDTMLRLSIDFGRVSGFKDSGLFKLSDLDFNKVVRYVELRQKLEKSFGKIPELSYDARKKNLESLVTARATYLLDGRLINFYQNNKADAETLRTIIRSKQRFPKDEFAKLKAAFPCILAGIRDYAEYIPLEPEMFDLVIIDEASQVSIAQAFPALLRAKKILILGDRKQFSNIKAAQARSDTNREYLNRISESFRKNVSDDVAKLVKLDKFNIKTSILEFFEFISNYNIQLLKHFRGYKEIISYSNKYFYQNNLQVMKIRGKSISDVIKFTVLEDASEKSPYPNSNISEANFIINELKNLYESRSTATVGIITPHTNQQKMLTEMIYKLPEKDYYFDKLKLKIMTFDTCQGEERDIIYYSLVATEDADRLWGVFIKDLNNVEIEEEGQIKAQRLNVGLSRAKETMHFVLSKSVDKFSGSIGEALRHYSFVLEEAKKEHGTDETDKNSKMESELLNWFYQTEFWREHKDSIDFVPQFEIGKYLKQLDKTYSHPDYKVDFLLTYRDEGHREHMIIIEYDGFREHFKDAELVNEFNYQDYYTDGDVYRQKVLESYGYKFLRVNKFNIGKNPIETLDERIAGLVKITKTENPLLVSIRETVSGLHNGEMKECPKCKEIRNCSDFKDPTLITGFGRFCKACKSIRFESNKATQPAPLTDKNCPRCSMKMVLRNGRRGKFYGCSRFPYCKGTRNF